MQMNDYHELLIGAGSSTEKRIISRPELRTWQDLTTLDIERGHDPDILHDLNVHPLPFSDNAFNEIHAYEVLEHLGRQGDFRFFFREFEEYARILRPKGLFCATVPSPLSRWVWGDPSHTRAFPPEYLVFLSQSEYDKQVGVTPMSDFRSIYKADFKTVYQEVADETFYFVLENQK